MQKAEEIEAESRGTSADVEGRYRLYRQSHIAIPRHRHDTIKLCRRRREAQSTSIDRTRIQQRYKQRHARSLPSSLLFTCPSHTSPIPLPYLSRTPLPHLCHNSPTPLLHLSHTSPISPTSPIPHLHTHPPIHPRNYPSPTTRMYHHPTRRCRWAK